MLPDIPYKTRTKKVMQTQFGGLDRRKAAGNGTIESMKNMASEDWPLIGSRAYRYHLAIVPSVTSERGHGVFVNGDYIYFARGTHLYVRSVNSDTTVEVSSDMEDNMKAFAALGERVVIWPDKVIVNKVGEQFTVQELGASVSLTGATIGNGTYADVQADLNTITFPSGTDLSAFREGDGVTLVGTSHNDMTVVIRELDGLQMRFYANTFSEAETISSVDARVKRLVPDLTYLCSNENRVWGCDESTIWACKPGDPTNWYVFSGIATDSWFVQSGSAGKFTGCISYGGYPVFFKEDRVIKVYGNRATNFELSEAAQPGVLDGASGSLAVVGSALMYLSRDGFMHFTGGYPRKVDEALNTRYTTAISGADGLKYYAYAYNEAEAKREMLVFTPSKGAWHVEDIYLGEDEQDDPLYVSMAYGNALYAQRNVSGTLNIFGRPMVLPVGAVRETSFLSGVQFGPWDFQSFDSKYPTRLWLRISVEPRLYEGVDLARTVVQISYDGGDYEAVANIIASGEKMDHYLPVPIRRCRRFNLRIRSSARFVLHAIELELYAGPESRIP